MLRQALNDEQHLKLHPAVSAVGSSSAVAVHTLLQD
jgi:hypothetical protein